MNTRESQSSHHDKSQKHTYYVLLQSPPSVPTCGTSPFTTLIARPDKMMIENMDDGFVVRNKPHNQYKRDVLVSCHPNEITFNDRSFSHPRLTQQNWIVLGPTAQHLKHGRDTHTRTLSSLSCKPSILPLPFFDLLPGWSYGSHHHVQSQDPICLSQLH